MPTMEALVQDFLAQKRIAVAGVSRKSGQTPNMIYQKLKDTGHEVYAINPNAQMVEGDPCYPDVKSTPARPDGVMIVTRPELTEKIVRDCAEAGITRVWMHCSLLHGARSTSDTAVKFCEEHGISVIPSGCPMMYAAPVDFAHKCMKWMMRVMGRLPK